MEDELWLKKIKDKLEDYSEPLPADGWERLEKELSVSGAPITGPHRMIPFRRWAVAAAAVLLVAVSSVSLWLLQSPVGHEMRHTSVPALAVAPDVLPEQTVPAVRANSIEPAYRAHGNASAPNREASHPWLHNISEYRWAMNSRRKCCRLKQQMRLSVLGSRQKNR